MLTEMIEGSVLRNVVASTLVVLVLVLARSITIRWIRRTEVASPELRARWLATARSVALLVLAFALIIVWASELRTVALSFVALAVAAVVATKELLLCLSGSILKSGARSFTIGDRIQVKEFRGDVIDQTLLATTILEVGPGRLTHQRTGRMITVPNSLFVSEPVINESFSAEYVLHVFVVPRPASSDWPAARAKLLELAHRHCEPFVADSETQFRRVAEKRALDSPSVEPRVTLHLPDPDRVDLVVRVPAPARLRGRIEQLILNDFAGSLATGPAAPRSADGTSTDAAPER